MSLLCYPTRLKSRYLLSVLVGLSLGFVLSLACLPLMSVCDQSMWIFSSSFPHAFARQSHGDSSLARSRHARSLADETLFVYRSQDYEPEVLLFDDASKVNSSVNRSVSLSTLPSNTTRIVRPRYAADELNMREKVLVAVLTEAAHLDTFAVFLNQTLGEQVDRLLFFVNDDVNRIPQGLEVLAIRDKRAYLKPFYVMKHLAQKMTQSYDWFFLVADNTFIRGSKLIDLLDHISINQELYLGQTYDDAHDVYCYFGSGIILSRTVLVKVLDELEWCTKNAYSQNITDNIGRCISKATKLSCVTSANDLKFSAYAADRFEFDTDVAELSQTPDFNASFTVHPVKDLETMLKLQMYFNEVEINDIADAISSFRDDIESLSCFGPHGCGKTPWPTGAPAPFKPPTRFDVVRWDYFNETHIYLKHDNDVIDLLQHDDAEDIREVIQHSLQQFQKTYGASLTLKNLLNGYRQFDPTRGTHYILDMCLVDDQSIEYVKRAELLRPLGLVEIVPMPFVTETTKVFLILPIHSDEESAAIRFLNHANRTLFGRETRERFELLLTHIVTSKQEFANRHQWFQTIRRHVDAIHQTREKLLITFHTTLLPSSSIPRHVQASFILDFFQTKVRSNALIFLTNPHVDLDADFLNRCRLNVIPKSQIFFPVAFYQYHPHIIGRTHPIVDNVTIEIHKSHGWFNSYAFDHVGLYLSDYVHLKNLIFHVHNALATTNLHDLFVQFSELHVLRAPDPLLRVHYRPVTCEKLNQSSTIEYQRCLMQQEKGLASRSQLAMVIVEHEHGEDEGGK